MAEMLDQQLGEALAAPAPKPGTAITASSTKLKGKQKAAVLLVSLGAERAAQVFRHLREAEIEQLSLEMAKMEHLQHDEVDGVLSEASEQLLAAEYIAQGGVDFAREVLESSVGPDRAQEIIGRLSAIIAVRPFEFMRRTPPEQIQAFLAGESTQTLALVVANMHTSLGAQVLAQLPEEIKMLLFVFEDIVKLDVRSVQLVLKDVDQKDLAMALRGVSEEVKQKILGNMSQRGAEMLLEEMEYQPPQRRSVIEEAQSRIVGTIRRLEDAGAIVIARGGDDEEEAEELV